MKLKVKQSSWSLWSNSESKDIEITYDIILNEKYVVETIQDTQNVGDKTLETEREVLSFIITDIDEYFIKIHTFQKFSIDDGGVIDIVNTQDEFIVQMNRELRIATPVMDNREVFTFTLINN